MAVPACDPVGFGDDGLLRGVGAGFRSVRLGSGE